MYWYIGEGSAFPSLFPRTYIFFHISVFISGKNYHILPFSYFRNLYGPYVVSLVIPASITSHTLFILNPAIVTKRLLTTLIVYETIQ